jgi:hypothetical protein
MTILYIAGVWAVFLVGVVAGMWLGTILSSKGRE